MADKFNRFECRVYFEDTDAGGVVYHSNYLNFYERARTEFLRSLGYEQDELLSQNIVFVVRTITVDFKQAARFNERLQINTQIASLKKASLVFDQKTYSIQAEQQPCVNQAQVKVVCVTANSFKPTAIPADIYRKLKKYE